MRSAYHIVIGAALAAICIGCAHAEIVAEADSGLSLRETVHVAATPDKAYAALIRPSQWWSSEHSFSGDAANMTLDAKAGGCWCETLADGGSVLHMTVVNADPGKVLRMRGALGPLQGEGVDGAMTFKLKAAGGGTDITLTYNMAGWMKDGFKSVAQAGDSVLGEQVARLKRFVETGSPEAAKTKQ